MKCLFIDETELDDNGIFYFGVCGIFIDITFYDCIRRKFSDHFKKLNWDFKTEYKGRYLFTLKACKNVSKKDKIEFIKSICELAKTDKNKRFKVYFSGNQEKKHHDHYKKHLKNIIKSIPNAKTKSGHKKLLAIFLDYTDELKKNKSEIINFLANETDKKNWNIFERPLLINSDNHTMGIFFADAIAYLAINTIFKKSKYASDVEKLQIMKDLLSLIPIKKCN